MSWPSRHPAPASPAPCAAAASGTRCRAAPGQLARRPPGRASGPRRTRTPGPPGRSRAGGRAGPQGGEARHERECSSSVRIRPPRRGTVVRRIWRLARSDMVGRTHHYANHDLVVAGDPLPHSFAQVTSQEGGPMTRPNPDIVPIGPRSHSWSLSNCCSGYSNPAETTTVHTQAMVAPPRPTSVLRPPMPPEPCRAWPPGAGR